MNKPSMKDNLQITENAAMNITHNQNFYESKLKIIDIYERLIEILILMNELNDIHSSIMLLEDFISQLKVYH